MDQPGCHLPQWQDGRMSCCRACASPPSQRSDGSSLWQNADCMPIGSSHTGGNLYLCAAAEKHFFCMSIVFKKFSKPFPLVPPFQTVPLPLLPRGQGGYRCLCGQVASTTSAPSPPWPPEPSRVPSALLALMLDHVVLCLEVCPSIILRWGELLLGKPTFVPNFGTHFSLAFYGLLNFTCTNAPSIAKIPSKISGYVFLRYGTIIFPATVVPSSIMQSYRWKLTFGQMRCVVFNVK